MYYLQQIVTSLIYLHQNKVIHREYINGYVVLNWEIFFWTKIWKLNLEILGSLLVWNITKRRKKLFAEHPTTLPLKFLKGRDTPMKLTSGQ